MREINADGSFKFWRIAARYRGKLFHMQSRGRYFGIQDDGYWLFPALRLTENEDVEWVHLMFPARPSGTRLKLYPPSSLAITPSSSCRLLRYKVLPAVEPIHKMKAVAVYPWQHISGMTVAEYQRAEMSLACLYSCAEVSFRNEGSLPKEFACLYRQLTSRGLLGFLRDYAPDFVAALRVHDDQESGGF